MYSFSTILAVQLGNILYKATGVKAAMASLPYGILCLLAVLICHARVHLGSRGWEKTSRGRKYYKNTGRLKLHGEENKK